MEDVHAYPGPTLRLDFIIDGLHNRIETRVCTQHKTCVWPLEYEVASSHQHLPRSRSNTASNRLNRVKSIQPTRINPIQNQKKISRESTYTAISKEWSLISHLRSNKLHFQLDKIKSQPQIQSVYVQQQQQENSNACLLYRLRIPRTRWIAFAIMNNLLARHLPKISLWDRDR